METNQSGNKNKIFIAIIVALLAINLGVVYMLYSENKDKKDVQAAKVELDNQYQMVLEDLEARKQELDQYKGRTEELDRTIAERQAEIEQYKQEIETLLRQKKISGAELAKARQLIAQLQSENKEFMARIDSLTSANQELYSQNMQLGQELEQERSTTTQLSDEKKMLSKKVELGSLLQLGDVEVVGVRNRNSGKESTTKSIKRVEQLRISFETGDNKVLEPGNLSLFLRIINPKGETISVKDQGSGTFKLANSGDEIQYTKRADIDYRQASKKVTVYWSQNITQEGTYKVEVYQSGHLIGRGECELKKGL
jgi:hypothetical protein